LRELVGSLAQLPGERADTEAPGERMPMNDELSRRRQQRTASA